MLKSLSIGNVQWFGRRFMVRTLRKWMNCAIERRLKIFYGRNSSNHLILDLDNVCFQQDGANSHTSNEIHLTFKGKVFWNTKIIHVIGKSCIKSKFGLQKNIFNNKKFSEKIISFGELIFIYRYHTWALHFICTYYILLLSLHYILVRSKFKIFEKLMFFAFSLLAIISFIIAQIVIFIYKLK